MKRTGKLMLSTFLFAYVTACSSAPTRKVRNYSEDRVYVPPGTISCSNILIPKPKGADAVSEASELMSYLNFLDKYQERTDGIIDELKRGHFYKVQGDIKDLAELLENDPSPYSMHELMMVKTFNYTVYEISDVIMQESERKNKLNVMDIIFSPLYAIGFAFDVTDLMLDTIFRTKNESFGNTKRFIKKNFPKEMKEKLVGRTFNIVNVTPYTGKRNVLKRNVSYEKLDEYMNR